MVGTVGAVRMLGGAVAVGDVNFHFEFKRVRKARLQPERSKLFIYVL